MTQKPPAKPAWTPPPKDTTIPVQYEVVNPATTDQATWKVLNDLVMKGRLKLISWQD